MSENKIIVRVVSNGFLDIAKANIDPIKVSIARALMLRLKQVAEENDINNLIEAINVEKNILAFTAEQYASIDDEVMFEAITELIEEFIVVEDKILALKG